MNNELLEIATKTIFKMVLEMYNVDLFDTIIETDVKGKVAGWACPKNEQGVFTLKFNREALDKHPIHMIGDTLPHEVAHLVCFARPELGKNHDAGWKAVCKALGGTAARCHDMELTPTRKTRTFMYRDAAGLEDTLTIIRHNKLQRGKVQVYINNKTKQEMRKSNFVKEITC